MNIQSRIKTNGNFEITAKQNDVVCTATMPTSAEALSIAIRSCYQIIDTLEGLKEKHIALNVRNRKEYER